MMMMMTQRHETKLTIAGVGQRQTETHLALVFVALSGTLYDTGVALAVTGCTVKHTEFEM